MSERDYVQQPVDVGYEQGIQQMGRGKRASAAEWFDAIARTMAMGLAMRGGVGSPMALERLVRLFRGEAGPATRPTQVPDWVRAAVDRSIAAGTRPPRALEGRWFGPKKEAAWYYHRAPEAVMKEVLVPESVAQASLVSRAPAEIAKWSKRPEREYLLPPEWAQRAKRTDVELGPPPWP